MEKKRLITTNKHLSKKEKVTLFIFSFIIILTSIVVILTLNLYNDIDSKLSGMSILSSSSLNEDVRFYIKKSLMDILNKKYKSSRNEFVFCLDAFSDEDIIIINGGTEPETIESTPSSISYYPCYGEGTIHSHPPPEQICEQSKQDIWSFAVSSRSTRHNQFDCIICGENKVSCWTENTVKWARGDYATII